ncbi:hypothetical protein [Crocosphaera sp.]|uniref:hypothetical protein n=1 Tax=Crocosphaera sp. TaxID=2729996 RepID=UPI0026038125|nr:hypothetical protein [Crocosphaera sp.]MDJ0581481.1 hypothetical protein [Crocosphaera sp.]
MNPETRNKNQIPWTEEHWKQIDMAVHDECKRTKVAAKYLPLYPAPGAKTVPSDTVLLGNQRDRQGEEKLTIDETATTPILELEVQFRLTQQQIMESDLSSAITLATRATNLLSQGVDIAIHGGPSGIRSAPLFRDRRVVIASGQSVIGLLEAPEFSGETSRIQTIQVPTTSAPGEVPRWGENIFGAISLAYSRLQSGEGLAQAHYGPYACILNFQPYADSYAPLPTTLIIPADRIKPLVTAMSQGMMSMSEDMMKKHTEEMQSYGRDISYMYAHHNYPRYYGTGTIPLNPNPLGLFLSLGGNTMDLVIGQDAITEYVRQEGNFYCFRVYERFALRLKDPTSVIRLEFQEPTCVPPTN